MPKKTRCPVCSSNFVECFLRRQGVPVHQNLVIAEQQEARDIARGDLDLNLCHECGFLFNHAFDPLKLSYGAMYDNTQTYSSAFELHVDKLIRYLHEEQSVRNCTIVEVGCGKGGFLRKMVEDERLRNVGYGFDPAYEGPSADLDGRLNFEKRYYDLDCSTVVADVVICRHVLEHVPDPVMLLRAIRQTLASDSRARLFVETRCVEWILKSGAVWDLFYEHCSYFSASSLSTACQLAGFRVERVLPVFEGQYLWLEAVVTSTPVPVVKQPGAVPRLAEQFAESEMRSRVALQSSIKRMTGNGKIALWGAGAKGVTLANLLDPQCRWVSCVVDVNPQKQGHYLPGTGHPIVAYQELPDYAIKTAILMNPNYRSESQTLLRDARLDVSLVDVGGLLVETAH